MTSSRLKLSPLALLGIFLVAVAAVACLPYSRARWYAWEGERLQHSGQLPQAEDAYQKSLAIEPTPQVMDRLGQTYLQAQQPDRAVEVLRQAAVIAPEDPQVHYDLGLSLLKTGQLPAAKQQLLQVVGLDHNHAMAHLALSHLALAQNNPVLAQQELQIAVQNGADTPDTHLRMGEQYLASGDPRAEKELRAALSLDSTLADAHLRLGFLLLQKDDKSASDELQAALDDGLAGADNRARALTALGLLAYRAGDGPRALAYLQEAAALHPGAAPRSTLAYATGVLRRDASDSLGAMKAFDTAVAENPGEPAFRTGAMVGRLGLYGDAVTAERQGRIYDAETDLRNLVAVAPHDPEYRLQLGNLLLMHHDTAGAIGELREALMLAPSDPRAWLRLSNALLQGGRYEESLSAGQQAIRLAPQWPQTRPDVDLLLGRINLACNRPRDAAAYLQLAANTNSPLVNNQECRDLLATANQRAQELVPAPAVAPPAPTAIAPAPARVAPAPDEREPRLSMTPPTAALRHPSSGLR